MSESQPRPSADDVVLDDLADPKVLRRAFTLYPRGVMAVAASIDGRPFGLAVSAFVSVSLDPPLVAICIDKASTTWPALSAAPALGVSVIAEDQAWLGRQLASRRTDRFEGAPFTATPNGALLLGGSPSALECSVESTVDGGDHLVVLLRVLAIRADPSIAPLVWHDSSFARLITEI